MCQCSGSAARPAPETRFAKAFNVVFAALTVFAIIEAFRDPRGR
jgi:hypothetical protein